MPSAHIGSQTMSSPSLTFQKEWHEGQNGRLKFADSNAISTVVARRLDETVKPVEHFAQLSDASKNDNFSNERCAS